MREGPKESVPKGRPLYCVCRFSCRKECLSAATDRSLPHRHRSTSLHLLNKGVASHHHTPCGTRAHNLRIRGPTPCPLGQGGSCCGSSRLSTRMTATSLRAIFGSDDRPCPAICTAWVAAILVDWSGLGVQPLVVFSTGACVVA